MQSDELPDHPARKLPEFHSLRAIRYGHDGPAFSVGAKADCPDGYRARFGNWLPTAQEALDVFLAEHIEKKLLA